MAIIVEIGDRLYDYTDEEVAQGAIEAFQAERLLEDAEVVEIWSSPKHPLKTELEARIFAAIDANGSVKRANSSIPGDLALHIQA